MGNKISYIITIILIILVAAGAFYYFAYYKKQGESDREEIFSEETLNKMGQPQNYFYVSGKIAEIDTRSKKILVEIDSVTDFRGGDFSSDYRGLVRNFVVDDETQINKIEIPSQFDFNNLSSSTVDEAVSETVKLVGFSELKRGGQAIFSVLKNETEKDDNWITNNISLQN